MNYTNAPKVEYEIPTIDSMEALAKEFKKRSKEIVIGFAVNPATMRFLNASIPYDEVRNKIEYEYIHSWKGIKVHKAKKQLNNCIPFYNKEALQKHLKIMNSN